MRRQLQDLLMDVDKLGLIARTVTCSEVTWVSAENLWQARIGLDIHVLATLTGHRCCALPCFFGEEESLWNMKHYGFQVTPQKALLSNDVNPAAG